jgi:lycopene cyclase domain-containing protein
VPQLYVLLNLSVLLIPLAFSWHPRLRFVDRWSTFWPACLAVLVAFIAWDVLFAALGVWGFNDTYLLGPAIAGLPIEEWLFFVCIPYACVFTYHCLGLLTLDWIPRRVAAALSVALLLLCAALALSGPARLYTFVTSLALVAFFMWLLWRRPAWMGRLWSTLLVLTVPFVLTNGVLTGLRFWEYPPLNSQPEFVVDQVVWYDNAHNLGIRFFSIPVDDFLYALLLIGLNVALMEWLESRVNQAD